MAGSSQGVGPIVGQPLGLGAQGVAQPSDHHGVHAMDGFLGLFHGPGGVRFATPLDLGLPASQVGQLHGGQILIERQGEIVGDLIREGLAAFVKGKRTLSAYMEQSVGYLELLPKFPAQPRKAFRICSAVEICSSSM